MTRRSLWAQCVDFLLLVCAGATVGMGLANTLSAGNCVAAAVIAVIGVAVFALACIRYRYRPPSPPSPPSAAAVEAIDRLIGVLRTVRQGRHLLTPEGDLLLVSQIAGMWIVTRVSGEAFRDARSEFLAGAEVSTVRRDMIFVWRSGLAHCHTQFVAARPGEEHVPVPLEDRQPTLKELSEGMRMGAGVMSVAEIEELTAQVGRALPMTQSES